MIDFLREHIISFLIVWPLLGAGLVASLARYRPRLARWIGLGASLAPLLLWLWIIGHFRAVGGFEFSEYVPWIQGLGVSSWLAVDGVSLFLIGLTVLMVPLIIVLSLEEPGISVALVLTAEAFFVGALASMDLFQFLFFLELGALAFFFLIGLARRPKSVGVTRTFLAFQLVGSALLWLCALIVSDVAGHFHLAALMETPLDPGRQTFWCGIFLIGIGLKVALIPAHTWFRKLAATLSPILSILVTVLFINIGFYAILRFAPVLFPSGLRVLSPILSLIGVAALFVSALLAFGAKDIQVKVAYFVMGQVAWILFGISLLQTDAIQGALFHIVSYSLVAAALGLVVLGRCPRVLALLIFIAAIGIPGTSSFVGLFLIALTGYQQNAILVVLAMAAWLFLATALVRHLKTEAAENEIIGNEGFSETPRHRDIKRPILWLLIFLIVLGGLFPSILLERSEGAVTKWFADFQTEGKRDVD